MSLIPNALQGKTKKGKIEGCIKIVVTFSNPLVLKFDVSSFPVCLMS